MRASRQTTIFAWIATFILCTAGGLAWLIHTPALPNLGLPFGYYGGSTSSSSRCGIGTPARSDLISIRIVSPWNKCASSSIGFPVTAASILATGSTWTRRRNRIELPSHRMYFKCDRCAACKHTFAVLSDADDRLLSTLFVVDGESAADHF
jgi:hypothetical protein